MSASVVGWLVIRRPEPERPPVALPEPPRDASVDHPFEGGPEPALVDLLQRTPATVTVSSSVDNGKDLPEHLVDGRLDTAWQGATGQLKGSWIELEVPASAHVARIGITAGYDAVSDASGDLFTENYRISWLHVSREGKSLGEWTLDAHKRGLQYFDVNAGGGKFRLDVSGVEFGSKQAWQEICVSELVVLGTSPDASTDDHAPPVTVAEWPDDHGEAITEDDLLQTSPDGGAPGCELRDKTPVPGNDKTFLSAGQLVCGSCSGDTWLAVETSAGWFKTNATLTDEQCGDPGGSTTASFETHVDGGLLVARVTYTYEDFDLHWGNVDEHGVPINPGAHSHPTTSGTEKTTAFALSGKHLLGVTRTTAKTPTQPSGSTAQWRQMARLVVTNGHPSFARP